MCPAEVARSRRRTVLRWVSLLVAVGATDTLALVGCSSADTQHERTTQSDASTSDSRGHLRVLDDYGAGVQAIADALTHSDPDWPALHQWLVDPELQHVTAVIESARRDGNRTAGSARVLGSKIIDYSPPRAEVQGCVTVSLFGYEASKPPQPQDARTPTYNYEEARLVQRGQHWAIERIAVAPSYATPAAAGALCTGS
jgi:hypothetical protein